MVAARTGQKGMAGSPVAAVGSPNELTSYLPPRCRASA